MKNTETGDQSGGLDRRDGSSTPAHHVGHNAESGNSEETAVSTVDKNDVAAFRPAPRPEAQQSGEEREKADW
jgi:hypothetical protein